jgi:hypothetical protein
MDSAFEFYIAVPLIGLHLHPRIIFFAPSMSIPARPATIVVKPSSHAQLCTCQCRHTSLSPNINAGIGVISHPQLCTCQRSHTSLSPNVNAGPTPGNTGDNEGARFETTHFAFCLFCKSFLLNCVSQLSENGVQCNCVTIHTLSHSSFFFFFLFFWFFC